MKKWHMEGIVSGIGRSTRKLEIPDPGQRSWLSAVSSSRVKKDFVLMRFLRFGRSRGIRIISEA